MSAARNAGFTGPNNPPEKNSTRRLNTMKYKAFQVMHAAKIRLSRTKNTPPLQDSGAH